MSNISDPTAPDLGELEQIIMNLVWEKRACTADAVREALRPVRPLKDSTIRTVLRRLEEKGLVTHSVEGRTYVYEPVEAARNFAARAVGRIMERFCGGSLEQLLVGMVDNQMVDRTELEGIARKIARAKKEKAK